MDSPKDAARGNTCISDVHLLRKDYLSAQLVEIGIVIQVLQGMDSAVDYLTSRKVDRNVVRRVMLHPSQRRKYAEQHLEVK
jgi:hypothetical protein